ncbi:hypothetical protein ACWCQS_07180 [Streptomyces sp. NPDC002076]
MWADLRSPGALAGLNWRRDAVLLDPIGDRQARDLLGNPLLQIHHRQGMTCVLDSAQALCRLRGTIDDPLVTPDTHDCRPWCRNVARTDRDIQHLRQHHRELAAVAPLIRHDRERHELTHLQRILDAHEPENHQ